MKKLVDGKIYNNHFKIMSALFIILPLLIIDQLSKFIILKNFHPGDSIPVIKNVFHISLVLNKGAAFGIFSERGSIFMWISIVAVIIIIFIFTFFYPHTRNGGKKKSTQILLSLVLAGAIGNLIDRMRFGYVVDFLDLRIWPVFNIADSAITIGTVLLVLQMLKHKKVV